MQATFELLTFPNLRLVAKVPFAAAPAACSWPTPHRTFEVSKVANALVRTALELSTTGNFRRNSVPRVMQATFELLTGGRPHRDVVSHPHRN
jgi:hypothetical protein